ncbi:hypothetical protein, partial [Klebsiella pneumoniae]|uniref:hypothetical protein n=1 Tax=Klebsiella pneumoniae TaxID=573 RepID=UPI002731A3DE
QGLMGIALGCVCGNGVPVLSDAGIEVWVEQGPEVFALVGRRLVNRQCVVSLVYQFLITVPVEDVIVEKAEIVG